MLDLAILVRGTLHRRKTRSDVANLFTLVANSLEVGDGLNDCDNDPQIARRAETDEARAWWQEVAGVQPHTFGLLGVPPPQVSGAVHVPQSTTPPHPSGTVPQSSPAGHAVAGVQPQTLGLLGVPPPQVCGAVQVPHEIVPPQPSGMVPQLSGAGHAFKGTQPPTQMSSCVYVAETDSTSNVR